MRHSLCVLVVNVCCTVCLCLEAECVDAFRLNVRISCKRVTELDEELVEWAFQLTKSNMQLL